MYQPQWTLITNRAKTTTFPEDYDHFSFSIVMALEYSKLHVLSCPALSTVLMADAWLDHAHHIDPDCGSDSVEKLDRGFACMNERSKQVKLPVNPPFPSELSLAWEGRTGQKARLLSPTTNNACNDPTTPNTN